MQGDDVQLAEVEGLIQEFDIDGSGEVDLTEFIYVLALQRRSVYTQAEVTRYAAVAPGCLLPALLCALSSMYSCCLSII